MAITSESQILSVQKVKNATLYLDDAANYLSQAKESLLSGKEKSGPNAIMVDGKSPFTATIDELVAEIESEIALIRDYSTKIKSDAQTISTSERKAYDKYQADKKAAEEKKKKEEAEKASRSQTATAVRL